MELDGKRRKTKTKKTRRRSRHLLETLPKSSGGWHQDEFLVPSDDRGFCLITVHQERVGVVWMHRGFWLTTIHPRVEGVCWIPVLVSNRRFGPSFRAVDCFFLDRDFFGPSVECFLWTMASLDRGGPRGKWRVMLTSKSGRPGRECWIPELVCQPTFSTTVTGVRVELRSRVESASY